MAFGRAHASFKDADSVKFVTVKQMPGGKTRPAVSRARPL